jgi:hypothetical protein
VSVRFPRLMVWLLFDKPGPESVIAQEVQSGSSDYPSKIEAKTVKSRKIQVLKRRCKFLARHRLASDCTLDIFYGGG